MLSDLKLNIKNIGPVEEVNIGIGKINVIGGLNATGKSTVSKLLYCILKGNVANRQEFAYSLIRPALNSFLRHYRNQIVHGGFDNSLSEEELFNFSNRYRNIGSLSDQELSEIFEEIKNDLMINDITINSWKSENLIDRTKKMDRQIEVIGKNDNELYICQF